jgi:hypothetical protein
MGMYTEFHFNAKLIKDVDKNVLDILRYMLHEIEEAPDLPNHSLFSTKRWRLMLKCDSYYFSADTHSTLKKDDISGSYFLCVRCNLKNYDGEIEKFVDWIMPNLNEADGSFLGFSRSEETEQPTLIFMKEQKH